jgi:hypothetical protein
MTTLNPRHFALLSRLQLGGCTCNTKTPELRFHAEDCKYRLASEIERELLSRSQDVARVARSSIKRKEERDALRELDIEAVITQACGAYKTGESYTFEDVWNCIEAALKDENLAPQPPQADHLVAASEALRVAIEAHSHFAAGLAFGLAALARKNGMSGNGSMLSAMKRDAAEQSHSWDEEGDHCTKCGDPAWCAETVCKPKGASDANN